MVDHILAVVEVQLAVAEVIVEELLLQLQVRLDILGIEAIDYIHTCMYIL